MKYLPKAYPEIPEYLLSSIVACVGVQTTHEILEHYTEVKEFIEENKLSQHIGK